MEFILKYYILYFVMCLLNLGITEILSSSLAYNNLIVDVIQTFITNSPKLALFDFSFSVYTNNSVIYNHKGLDIHTGTTTNLLSVEGKSEEYTEDTNYYMKDCKTELISFIIVARQNSLLLSQVIDLPSAVELGRHFQHDEYLIASIREKAISPNCNKLLNENIQNLRLPQGMSLNISSEINKLQIRIWKITKETKFSHLFQFQQLKNGTTLYDLLKRRALLEDFQGMNIATVSSHTSEMDDQINTYKFINGTIYYDQGWAVFLLRDFQEMFNFSVTVKRTDEYIKELPSSVGGIATYLISGEVDIIIGSWYMLPYRELYMKSTLQLRQKLVAVFFMQPHRSTSAFRNVFAKPFCGDVWITIVASVVGLLMAYQIVSRFDKKLPPFEASALITAAALNQSYFSPVTISSRIFFISIILTFYVIWTSYGAYLISILTMVVTPISSFDSLVDNGYTIIATEFDNNSCQQIYKNHNVKSTSCNNFRDEYETIHKVFDGQYGYIKSVDQFSLAAKSHGYSDSDICRVSSIDFQNKIPLTSFYMHKDYAVLAWSFNPILHVMMVRGIMSRKNQVFKDATVKCNQDKLPYQENIGIQDVFVAFCLFFLGVTISLVMLICELFLFKSVSHQKFKKKF